MTETAKKGRMSNGLWLCQGYLSVLLLATAILGPLFYYLLAWALFASSLYFSFRPLKPRFALAYVIGVFFLVPRGLFSLADYPVSTGMITPAGFAALAALFAAPLLFLLDAQLKRYAGETVLEPAGSHLTSLSRTLFTAALGVELAAVIIGHLELMLAAAILLGYLLVSAWLAYRRLHRPAVDIPHITARVIAGNEAVVTRPANLVFGMALRAVLTPKDRWLRVTPPAFRLDRRHPEEPLVFEMAPPLSGPVHPAVTLSLMDERGLVQNDRAITPLELHVIPRAKYAGWLARKYLREGSSGWTSYFPVMSSTRRVAERKGRGEYRQSRDYYPGDLLRDVDWKHTLKLRRLVMKERVDIAERQAVLVVNLSVAGFEAADKLAYNLITTALTLSREAVPTSMVAYREEKVVLTLPLSDPRDVLKQCLKLVKDITAHAGQRCLEAADIAGLKRNIALLEKAGSPPALRLRELLELERRAVEKTATGHVATGAIFKVTGRLVPPAAVIMLSALNHDAEALAVVRERLKKRGFTTYVMAINGHESS